MAGSLGLPALMIFFIVFFVADLRGASNPSTGVFVLLPHPCSSHGDSRDLVIRYLPGEKLWLSEESMEKDTLRAKVKELLAPRFEKLLWVAADERVGFGEVAELLAMLHQDNPDVYIALVTKKQMGPVDPVDPAFRRAQLNPNLGIYSLCIQGLRQPRS